MAGLQMSCRLKSQHGGHVNSNIDAYKFLNPYSEQLEYVVASIEVLLSADDLDPIYSSASTINNGGGGGAYLVANNPTAPQVPLYNGSEFNNGLEGAQYAQNLIMPPQGHLQQQNEALWVGQQGGSSMPSVNSAGRYLAEFNAATQEPQMVGWPNADPTTDHRSEQHIVADQWQNHPQTDRYMM